MVFRFLAWAVVAIVVSFALAPSSGRAQEPTTPAAEVNSVRFRQVRAAGASTPWVEAEVVVQARGNPDDPFNPRWVSRLKTELFLAYNLARGGESRIEYYRAGATAVAVEAGRSVFRFYLPPEVVKRDGLPTTPDFWLVVLSVGGRELPLRSGNVSRSLEAPDRAQRFRERAAAEAPVNDGVLVPSHLSPFEQQNRGEVPSMVRT